MFARMVTVRMRPNSRYVGERLAMRWHQGVATLPDFVSVSFFLDDAAGVYGYYSVWKSREAAERVRDEIGEQVADATREFSRGEPEVAIYEVYEPPA